jgi:hypothetical protein
MEPAPKRARATNAPAQCSPSTMTTKGRFIPLTPPLTPEIGKADGPNTTEYDRGFSGTRQVTKGGAHGGAHSA